MYRLNARSVAIVSALCCALSGGVARAQAEPAELESLHQQLTAQQAINLQLRRRVDALERLLAEAHGGVAPSPLALDADAPPPPADLDDPSATSAIEEALGAKGLLVLKPGGLRLTPAFSWTQAGSADVYGMSLGASTGLPAGLMLSLGLPYREVDTPWGSNSGGGDVSLGLSKLLWNEAPGRPSLVASLGYTHDNGKDPFGEVPIGTGFRGISVGLSALQRISPLAFYGNLSWSHAYARMASWSGSEGRPAFDGRLAPRNAWGAGLGVSLAVTPEVSLDLGWATAFGYGTRVEPVDAPSFTTARSRASYLNFGSSIRLSRHLLLNVSLGAGVSQQASDFIFSVALPYRF